MSLSTKHYHHVTLLLVCCAVVFAAYWPGLSGPFLLDDYKNIPFDAIGTKSWLVTIDEITSNRSGPLARPLSILSFFLHAGWQQGDGAFAFKLVNLCLHLVCGLLIFRLLSRLLSHRGIALGIASIWLLHPLLASTVLYSVQRMTILSSLFMLVAMNSYVSLRQKEVLSGAEAVGRLFLIFCAFVMGILSKENAFVLPVLLLVIEKIFFHEGKCHRQYQWAFVLFTSAVALLAIPLWPQWMLDYDVRGWTIAERLTTQLHVLTYYLQLIIWPTANELSLYHDNFPIKDHFTLESALLLMAYLVSIIGSFCFKRRFPWLFLGIAWFFICHSIESSIIPLEMVFEHRNYLASIGPITLLVYGCSLLGPILAIGLPILYMAFLLDLTISRAQIWSSLASFTQHTLEHKPESFRVHVDSARISQDTGHPFTAQEHLFKAQSLAPTNPGPSIHTLYFSCVDFSEVSDDQIQHAVAALRRGRDFSYALSAFQQLSFYLAQHDCDGLKRGHLISLIQLALDNENLALRPHQLGGFFYLQAMNFILDNDFTEAKRRLEKSYEADPSNPIPLLEKANIYAYEKNSTALLKTKERLSAFPQWRYPLLQARLKAIIDASRESAT